MTVEQELAELKTRMYKEITAHGRLTDGQRNEVLEEAALVALGYDRQFDPNFQALVGIIKQDIAYRIRKLKNG